jgi:hypothetical protein
MLEFLAERKIAEAIEKGELDDLPGEGRPLDLDDVALVPEDLRMAHRILKNAGFIPPEVHTLNEIAELERIAGVDAKAARKLALLRTRIESAYHEKVVKRFSR